MVEAFTGFVLLGVDVDHTARAARRSERPWRATRSREHRPAARAGRVVLTSSWARARPRRREAAAQARAGRRPRARAGRPRRSASSAAIGASGPAPRPRRARDWRKGGYPSSSRRASSPVTNCSTAWWAASCTTVASGSNACTITRPGSPRRPLRPASWVSRANVRSSARKSGHCEALVGVERRREPHASDVVPLRHHLRPDEHGRAGSRAKRSSTSSSAPRGAEASASRRSTANAGRRTRPRTASTTRSVPAPRRTMSTAPQVGQVRGTCSVCPQWWQRSRPRGVQGQADVAVGAAEPAAAGATVQRRRGAAPVEQEDRAAALVGEGAEPVAQRARERVVRVAPEVDHLDRRQRTADP